MHKMFLRILMFIFLLGIATAQKKPKPILKTNPTVQSVGVTSGAAVSVSVSPTTSAPTIEIDRDSALFRQTATNGKTCTLVAADAELCFYYNDVLKEPTEKCFYIMDDFTIAGHCAKEDQTLMIMRHKSFQLNWNFQKTPGGDRWYIKKVELKFNSSEKIFEHFPNKAQSIRLANETIMFSTPVGKSCAYPDEFNIDLNGRKDIRASVILRKFKAEPFLFKDDNFGPEFESCSPFDKRVRSETAPLAVGTTLAVVTLCTVTGYGIYRYFKIKKVQYDNME